MTATVDLRPGRLNVKSTRGDTVGLPIVINEAGVAADLTGRTFSAQLRKTKRGAILAEFDIDILDAAEGRVVLRLEPEITETLTGDYLWDLEQRSSGVPRTILAGKWTFEADVTREDEV